ncbi:ER membrane protein complex subunit 6-like [Styela clava]
MVKEPKHGNPGSSMVQYNLMAMRQNFGIAEYCRTGVSALGGVTAGILGLTGLYGFAFYVICASSLFIGILIKAGFGSSHKYFLSRKSVLLTGQFGALFTYILFWTFLYGMVHVY